MGMLGFADHYVGKEYVVLKIVHADQSCNAACIYKRNPKIENNSTDYEDIAMTYIMEDPIGERSMDHVTKEMNKAHFLRFAK